VVGDQAVSLPVDIGSSICRRGLGQAEHPPVFFVDQVPQVPHVVRGLGLQAGEMCLGDVVHCHAAGDFVKVHESGICGLLSSRWRYATTVKWQPERLHRRKRPAWRQRVPRLGRGLQGRLF
jgi:hypothetical protein